MKKKIVLWGKDPQENRVLMALELKPEKNEVDLLIFPEAVATEEFSNLMMTDWRNSKEVEFPAEPTAVNFALRAGGDLLPGGFEVERQDIVQRAQTEWQFIVLSHKLFTAFQAEIDDFKDRIDQAGQFEAGLWEELKGFWEKVQLQISDRNLFRDHIDYLRKETDGLFAKMKAYRSTADKYFQEASREKKDQLLQVLDEIENRLQQDARLQTLFNELKDLQREFREAPLTKGHRSKVWGRLDAAFKKVKEKKFGPEKVGTGNRPLDRLQKRYEGLLQAIDRMTKSIQRDQKDQQFENRRLEKTDGQLEAQIRQAKLAMIDERIRSKQEKLEDMQKTRATLEEKMKKEEAREARREEERRKKELAREVKEKIAREIQEANDSRKEQKERLSQAAEQITGGKESVDHKKPAAIPLKEIMQAIGTAVGLVSR